MLPAVATGLPSLADVMPSGLQSLLGRDNPLGFPSIKKLVVFVVDGLGVDTLAERSGHARTLSSALERSSVALAGFPTTTVSGLSTITTGTLAGTHGMIGYSSFDVANDRVVRPLSGWDDLMDPSEWQLAPTVFERAAEFGIPSHAIGIERFRNTGFTAAVLRGAAFSGAEKVGDRARIARAILDSEESALVYLYAAEFDHALHERGRLSAKALRALEEIDTAVAELKSSLGPQEAMVVIADHGAVDVPQSGLILFDSSPELLDGIRHIGGDPRALGLYFEPDASASIRKATFEAWRESESSRAEVISAQTAIERGWFGPEVSERVRPRIPDFYVLARKRVAYYDSRTANAQSLAMVGQHGSVTQEELRVPLLRFGALAA